MKAIYYIPILLLFMSSCEVFLFERNYSNETATENFEFLWKECDEKYAYFDTKFINWDLIHDKYAEMVNDSISDDSLFTVCAQMLNELQDGHVNLISDFNISHYNIEKLGQDNFDFRIISDNYISDQYYMTGPFAHDFVHDSVGYIRFSAFTGTMTDNDLEFIFKRYAHTKGLILDLRENGGGAISDVFTLLQCFVNEKTPVYHTRLKNGPAHNDFSDLLEVSVVPRDSTEKGDTIYYYPGNVAVLIDRSSYSASSFFAVSTKAINQIALIGDTTGGGLGIPNGGQLPNGWRFRFSISQTLTLDGKDYENGVPPDIPVLLDVDARKNGVDNILERAIEEILKD